MPATHPDILSFDDTEEPAGTPFLRTHLETLIVDRLVSAALRGWTPADLRHVAGRDIDPFLAAVRRQALAVSHPRVGAVWRRQCPPLTRRHRPTLPLTDLERLGDRLLALPTFTDVPYLTDVARLQDHPVSGPPLSAEQRRARQRITGLLQKAESTTFPAEAETLVAKAQQLRLRYRIDSLVEDVPESVVAVRVPLSAPWVKFQHLLLSCVAVPNSCRSVLAAEVGIATLIGHPDDVRHTAELFASLNRQRDYFMRHSPGAEDAALHGETSAYRRSFLHSYAHRIGDLLAQAGNAPDVTAAESAHLLPVLARRDTASIAARDQVFPHTSGVTFGHSYHPEGAVDGARAAEKSHLGTERTAVDSA